MKTSNEPYTRGSLILLGALMLLSLVSLSAWLNSPIFPDEVAFRLLSGRYIPDHGLAQRFFYICQSNARETPLLFVLPAWILSWLDAHLSLVEMRILPFFTVLAAIFLTIWFAVRGRNKMAAVVATTALLGVAGSGMIIARAEYWQVLNVACCVWVFFHLESISLRLSMRYCMLALLLFSWLFSMYIHVQGLIFLPLTLYLAYRIISPSMGRVKTIILLVALFFIVVKTTISFTNFSCPEYPGITQSIEKMVFNLGEFDRLKFTDWLAVHFNKYFQSFYYNDHYQINYLPGITPVEGWLKGFLTGLNQSIHIILLTNLIVFACATIAALLFAVKQSVAMYKLRARGGAVTKGLDEAYAIILFAFPLVFLFFYDANQNFYRSFFINFLTTIMVAIVLSRLYLGRMRKTANAYFFFCGAVVLASLVVNVWCFTDKFRGGFEGPSISTDKDWDAITRDVLSLAQVCDMDLSKGRIIVDDMTYDSLKRYPLLYPVTYLHLSGNISSLTSAEIINQVRPNYAIVRCDYLRSWGVTPQQSLDKLCAVNFLLSDEEK